MEQKEATTHIMKGIIIALIIIVINLIAQFTNIQFETWYRWGSLIISIGIFIAAPIIYGKEMNNNVTFGMLFSHGFKAAAVATCIVFVYTLLAVYVLFPDMIEKMIQQGLEEARKQGQQIPEQSAEMMSMAKKITTLVVLSGVVLIELMIGALGSALGAAIAKKNPQDPFAQPLT